MGHEQRRERKERAGGGGGDGGAGNTSRRVTRRGMDEVAVTGMGVHTVRGRVDQSARWWQGAGVSGASIHCGYAKDSTGVPGPASEWAGMQQAGLDEGKAERKLELELSSTLRAAAARRGAVRPGTRAGRRCRPAQTLLPSGVRRCARDVGTARQARWCLARLSSI